MVTKKNKISKEKNRRIKSLRFCYNNRYIKYTLAFMVLAFITFLPFLIEGKTFIWKTDGISQHYPILCYYGDLLKGLLSRQGFSMVDFKVGLGFDTISTLHYYVLGDPISLFSVFMTPSNSIFIYGALIILRLYLAGLSFILFARNWGKVACL